MDSIYADVIASVSSINLDIYNNSNPDVRPWIDDNGDLLTFSGDGTNLIIEYLGFKIWNSNDDQRKFDEQKNDYEPMEPYLINKIYDINELIAELIVG